MRAAILVAVGGALGSVARYWIGDSLAVLAGPGFPFATLAINVFGSFAIGALAALTAIDGRFAGDPTIGLLGMVGVCGGFTTFSAFSLQNLQMLQAGRLGSALVYIAASVVLCLGGTVAGMALFTRV